MSWSIYVRGTKEQVEERLSQGTNLAGFPVIEQEQYQMATDLIRHTVQNVNVEGKVFDVTASGSCSKTRDNELSDNKVNVRIETVIPDQTGVSVGKGN